ncbi:MAG: hypothetical protein ABI934_13155 [Actinomycetota bacterium]
MDGVETVNQLRLSGLRRSSIDLLPRIDGLVGLRQTVELGDIRLRRIQGALTAAPAGAILSGWAAAALHGIPNDFLDGTSDGAERLPVELIVPPDCGAYERGGLRLRWAPCRVEDLVSYQGHPVTNGRRTAADLTRWANYPEKALAAMDMCLRHGLASRHEIEYLQIPRMKGYRGIQLVRDAISIASDRAESPRESELRYYWLESDLPTPKVNAEVYDLRGRFMGRIDLLDEESGYGCEYNGHWHEMWDRPERDSRRMTGLRSLNLTIDKFTKGDLQGSSIARINSRFREGHARALARDPRHDAFRVAATPLGLTPESSHRP